MPLIVDTASSARRLDALELRAWASSRTVFLSSEMRQLGPLRARVSGALREAGFTVVAFEDLGGRDEDAKRAYLEGVARSDIYAGVLGDRYGTMLPSGRSPTHEEYLEARRRGKRITFWLQQDSGNRQGNAIDFAQEVQAFHTTGSFVDADDLAARLLDRLAEMGADDQVPWVKIRDACFRASRVRDDGSDIVITAEVRDPAVVRALEDLRGDQWGRSGPVSAVTDQRAGEARVTQVVSEARSASVRDVELTAEVSWADGRGGAMDAGFNGFTHDQLTEFGLRAGLLGEQLPPQLSGSYGFMVDSSDPLAELPEALPQAAQEAIARLLIVERLLGGGRASQIDSFSLGPAHLGQRPLELEYLTPRRYSNQDPEHRRIKGVRRGV